MNLEEDEMRTRRQAETDPGPAGRDDGGAGTALKSLRAGSWVAGKLDQTPDRAHGAQRAALVVDRPCHGVLVLCLRAGWDQPSCDAAERWIEEELAREATCRVIVDLHDVTALSVAAVAMLVRLRRLTWLRDMRLILVGVSRHAVHQPLHAAGLLPLLDTRPTVMHALPAPTPSSSGAGSSGRARR